nr:MAG TPA: hypothetical protein [Caudoviricetes sp.]
MILVLVLGLYGCVCIGFPDSFYGTCADIAGLIGRKGLLVIF